MLLERKHDIIRVVKSIYKSARWFWEGTRPLWNTWCNMNHIRTVFVWRTLKHDAVRV